MRVRAAGAALMAAALCAPAARAQGGPEALRPVTIIGDAIPVPLTGLKGDAGRGRTIVLNRQVGLCLLCHSGPFPEDRFQGNMAPDL
jgi:sulfur-oxidizing protein SoxX